MISWDCWIQPKVHQHPAFLGDQPDVSGKTRSEPGTQVLIPFHIPIILNSTWWTFLAPCRLSSSLWKPLKPIAAAIFCGNVCCGVYPGSSANWFYWWTCLLDMLIFCVKGHFAMSRVSAVGALTCSLTGTPPLFNKRTENWARTRGVGFQPGFSVQVCQSVFYFFHHILAINICMKG